MLLSVLLQLRARIAIDKMKLSLKIPPFIRTYKETNNVDKYFGDLRLISLCSHIIESICFIIFPFSSLYFVVVAEKPQVAATISGHQTEPTILQPYLLGNA